MDLGDEIKLKHSNQLALDSLIELQIMNQAFGEIDSICSTCTDRIAAFNIRYRMINALKKCNLLNKHAEQETKN